MIMGLLCSKFLDILFNTALCKHAIEFKYDVLCQGVYMFTVNFNVILFC